jgi:DNA-directed RNA polymerase sigma subunit (sigma70/sigma32)
MNEKFIIHVAKPVVEDAVQQLPPVQKRVLKFRWGKSPKTIEHVAAKLNLSRVKVRQIESNALRTIRRRMTAIRLQLAG